MSVSTLRQTVVTRRTVGDRIAASLVPLEQIAHQTAIDSSRFTTLVLEAHADAKLPPNAGMDIVTLLSEASNLAAQSRAKIGAAHDALRLFSAEHQIEYAGPPECPPNEFFRAA